MKPQPRWGDHIQQRGNVWHYWRIIPPDCRPAYGKSVKSQTLNTANEAEARRLAKAIDVELDRRIREIRSEGDPDTVAKRSAGQALIGIGPFRDPLQGHPTVNAYRKIRREIAAAGLTDEMGAKAEEYAVQEI